MENTRIILDEISPATHAYSPARVIALMEIYALPDAQVNGATAKELAENGLVCLTAEDEWECTRRGSALVQLILQTPFPIQAWIDPRTQKINA